MIKDALKLRGDLTIVLRDKDGNIKESRQETNLVVSAGLNFICDRMEGVTEGVMSHMGVGSGTTAAAAGDTDLQTVIGSRKALDSTTVSGATITYVASYDAGENTGTITEAGIFNASTAGTMLCRTVFGAVTKAAADTLQITWTITLSAS